MVTVILNHTSTLGTYNHDYRNLATNRSFASQWVTAIRKWIHDVWAFVKEDIDRVTFALKVGLAILLLSLLVLFQAPYEVFGASIIWSILTVVIMFEYTVGATFNRGLNRALGSLVAGIFAIVVIQVAISGGHVVEPYVIGLSIFLTGAFVQELVFLEVLRFNIGASCIAFVFLEDFVIHFRELSKAGELVSFHVCMEIMDLLYETEKTTTLFKSPYSLAASILVAAYIISVAKQQWEFPLLPWVKFVTSYDEEYILEIVQMILEHVLAEGERQD